MYLKIETFESNCSDFFEDDYIGSAYACVKKMNKKP